MIGTTIASGKAMKIAITDWNGRIAPVFDSARSCRLYSLKDTEIVFDRHIEICAGQLLDKIATLNSNDVQVLICGAISIQAERCLLNFGVEVYSFSFAVGADFWGVDSPQTLY